VSKVNNNICNKITAVKSAEIWDSQEGKILHLLKKYSSVKGECLPVLRLLLWLWPWPWACSCFTISTTLDTVSINLMSWCWPPGLLFIGVDERPGLLENRYQTYNKWAQCVLLYHESIFNKFLLIDFRLL
jgi:hypothetical protein